jgi:hypothetical protein
VVALADEALLMAKSGGRNEIVVARSEPMSRTRTKNAELAATYL